MNRYVVTLSKRVYVQVPVEADTFEDAVGAARVDSDYRSVDELSTDRESYEDEGWQFERVEMDGRDSVITTSRGLSYGQFPTVEDLVDLFYGAGYIQGGGYGYIG